MTRSRARRTLFALLFVSAMPIFVLGCPKKDVPPAVDAAPPPPEVDANITLGPPEEDASDAADATDANEAGKHWTGPAVNDNKSKIIACCSRISAQAAQLGNTPEAFQLKSLAAGCMALAGQVGPGGNAPEFAAVRGFLAQAKLPGGC